MKKFLFCAIALIAMAFTGCESETTEITSAESTLQAEPGNGSFARYTAEEQAAVDEYQKAYGPRPVVITTLCSDFPANAQPYAHFCISVNGTIYSVNHNITPTLNGFIDNYTATQNQNCRCN